MRRPALYEASAPKVAGCVGGAVAPRRLGIMPRWGRKVCVRVRVCVYVCVCVRVRALTVEAVPSSCERALYTFTFGLGFGRQRI